MLVKRFRHATVSMENKLFVIGGNYNSDCEVFDSISNKFILIKSIPKVHDVNAVSINYKIYVFQVVCGIWLSPNKSDIITFCYNDKQNTLVRENNLQVECQMVSCAKMTKI